MRSNFRILALLAVAVIVAYALHSIIGLHQYPVVDIERTEHPAESKPSISTERESHEAKYSNLAGNISSMAINNQTFINHFCQYKLRTPIGTPQICLFDNDSISQHVIRNGIFEKEGKTAKAFLVAIQKA